VYRAGCCSCSRQCFCSSFPLQTGPEPEPELEPKIPTKLLGELQGKSNQTKPNQTQTNLTTNHSCIQPGAHNDDKRLTHLYNITTITITVHSLEVHSLWMIQLGLQRAAQLFRGNPQPWKAVHVAGTNGKGTVCAYLSALLHAGGVPTGRFTSPHLIDR
jgi:hypothetical protein